MNVIQSLKHIDRAVSDVDASPGEYHATEKAATTTEPRPAASRPPVIPAAAPSVRGMSADESILAIDRAVEQSLGDREMYESESEQDVGRREEYQRAIERVDEVGGKHEAARLTTWLENEIRDEQRLPDPEEVREKGAEICGEHGGSVSPESLR